MNIRDALVAAVGYGLCIFLEGEPLEFLNSCKVMRLAWCEASTNDLFVLLADGQLAFGGSRFFLPE